MTAAELNVEFEAYCRAEYERWRKLPGNGPGPMMIWNPKWWFDRVEESGRKWRAHIDVLARDWWRQRGYDFYYENDEVRVDLLEPAIHSQ
jgi:hypothetical protein